MDKNKITWIGLGQGGSNIVAEAEKRFGYHCIYLNTSKEDLSSLKGVKYPIHIENGIGAAKNRKSVIKLMSESIDDIIAKINNLVTGDIVFVVFAAGGGTGSGSASFICKYLSQIGKIVVPVSILPSDDESAKSMANAYDCMAELSQIKGIGGIFLLDNSKASDKFTINGKFVADIDALLNINHSSQLGNIDEAEIRTLLSCPGVSVISRCSKPKSTAADIIHGWHNGIYTDIQSNTAMYVGVSTSNKSLDINSLTQELEGVFDTFVGYSESTTVAILAGLKMPMRRFDSFKNKFEKVVNTMNDTNFIQEFTPLQSIQGVSFNREPQQQTTTASPRDILLGLLGN